MPSHAVFGHVNPLVAATCKERGEQQEGTDDEHISFQIFHIKRNVLARFLLFSLKEILPMLDGSDPTCGSMSHLVKLASEDAVAGDVAVD